MGERIVLVLVKQVVVVVLNAVYFPDAILETRAVRIERKTRKPTLGGPVEDLQ